MNDKPFKSHDELLELLESRGIDFSEPGSKSFAKKKLQRIGYYNLITVIVLYFWKKRINLNLALRLTKYITFIFSIKNSAKFSYTIFFLSKQI